MEAALAILITLLLVASGAMLWLIRDRAHILKRASQATHDAVALRAERDAQHQAHGSYARQLEERLAERDAALRQAFDASAGQALKSTSESFLALANERIAGHLKPITDTLQRTDAKLTQIEKERSESFGSIASHLRAAHNATEQLRLETGNLVTALRRPQVRGRYGEIQLRRVVELAGMKSYCDFDEQASTRTDDGRALRPDLVVRLPNDRIVAVDAKANLDPYLDAIQASSVELARPHLERFARGVLVQAEALSKKRYWAQYEGSPEIVVMFVPGEQFIDAALEYEPRLLELSAQQHVLLAGPATLIGLLRAIAVGWREKNLSDHAQQLLRLGQEFHERAAVMLEHVDAVGKGLHSTTSAYNKLAGSIDTRLMPALRRFTASGAASGKKPEAPRAIDAVVAELKTLPQPKLPPRETGSSSVSRASTDAH